MTLLLSSREWDILASWAEKVLVDGHWGDGQLTLGEEEHILQLLKERPKAWEVSSLELRVLKYWIESLFPLSGEEKALANKISSLSQQH
ncbi:MAG: hypothetical protein N2314_04515 [Brevinematales bacterium]|nr:hypothetical protein [Brevinematales bacterium]